MNTAERKAVFLSYASQDAEAARHICEALRTAGVEVWFDVEGGLEHGDEWDAKIRRQIKECVLFIAVISRNTQARHEGYFRIEWELAAQRALGIASGIAFILPVVIDDTREPEALVPDRFRAVQWTRLPDGHVAPDVLARLVRLWSQRMGVAGVAPASTPPDDEAGKMSSPPNAGRRVPAAAWLAAAMIVAAVAVAIWQPWRRGSNSRTAVTATAPAPVPQTEVQKLLARVWALYEKQDDATGQDWTLAEDLAAQAVKRESNNADAWAAYSQATLGAWVFGYDRTATRLAEARSRAERALGLAPESFEARFAVANCHRRQAATRLDAEQALRTLGAERPGDKRVLRMLAQTLRDLQRTDEAIALLDRAAALPGGDPIAVWGKFAVYSAAGRYEEAEAAVVQSLAIRRGPSALLRQVAVRLVWHGDLDGAAAALREVPGPFLLKAEGVYVSYQLARWRRDPNACLAALQLAGGDVIEGSNYLPSPNSAVPTGLWRGDAYALAGNRDAAEKNWRDALAVVERRAREQPGESGWIFWRASLQARLGERTEGLRSYRLYQQLTGAGTDPASVFSFSRQNMRLAPLVLLGERDEALANWEDAMAAAPTPRHRELIRHELRLDPLYDGLRENPRFQALVAPPSVRALASPDAKSVAVLAFRPLSADPENEYLSEAISDELSSVLGRVPGLKVAASASAFSFKGRRVRPAEMATQLGVAYLVDGTVQKIGGRVRVRATLVKAADETTVWQSDPMEHEVKDMFAVQDQIVAAIAQNLRLQLGGGKLAPMTIDPEAYRLYYEGRRMWALRGALEPVERARALFEQAVQKDPNLGRAYAGLADTIVEQENSSSFGTRASPAAAEARRLTEKAIALEPRSAEARTSHGRMLWSTWRLPEAERELRHALELNPNYAEAHMYLGRLLHVDGRLDESLSELRKAMELDPLTSRIFDNYAFILTDIGRHAEALPPAERALALQPDSLQAKSAKLLALSGLGRHDEALAIARESTHMTRFVAGVALARAGRRDEAREWLKNSRGNSVGRTIVLLALGERDAALDTIPVDQVSMGAIGRWFYWPELDPVRNDPRFVRVLEQVGMKASHDRAQAWRAAHPPEKSATNK